MHGRRKRRFSARSRFSIKERGDNGQASNESTRMLRVAIFVTTSDESKGWKWVIEHIHNTFTFRGEERKKKGGGASSLGPLAPKEH